MQERRLCSSLRPGARITAFLSIDMDLNDKEAVKLKCPSKQLAQLPSSSRQRRKSSYTKLPDVCKFLTTALFLGKSKAMYWIWWTLPSAAYIPGADIAKLKISGGGVCVSILWFIIFSFKASKSLHWKTFASRFFKCRLPNKTDFH